MSKQLHKNVWWSTFSILPTRIINYITVIILARILTPQIFGEFSYAIILFQYFSLLENPGLQGAFIYSKQKPEALAGTFLVINIIISFFLFISFNITAPFFAHFFKSEHLSALMHWISISFFFSTTAFVHGAWLSKELNFKKKFFPSILSFTCSSLISIALALKGFGVWSLVAKHLSLSIVNTLVLMFMVGKRIPLRFDMNIAKSLFKYGLPLHCIVILGFLRINIDYLFVGKFLGAASLGLYRQAFNAIALPIYNLSLAVCSIAFPTLSAAHADKEKEHFNDFFRLQLGFIALPCFIFILIPESIVFTLFGEKWTGMIQPIRILAIFIFLRSLMAPFFEYYKAKGFLKIRIILSLGTIIILIPALIIGCQFGISGVALAHLIVYLPFFVLEFLLGKKYFRLNLKELIVYSKKVILFQIIIISIIFIIKSFLPSSAALYHHKVVSATALFTIIYYVLYMRKIKIRAQ